MVWTNDSEAAIGGERRNVIIGLALKKTQNGGAPAEGDREMYMEVIEMVVELLEKR